MAQLSKEEKKALMKKWEASQTKKYVLSKTDAKKLFHYIETQLENTRCNHTLHYTEQWLNEHLSSEKAEKVVSEIRDQGGYCDCEVLLNCYEKYDIV